MTMERLFIALPLGEEQRTLLQRQQKILQDPLFFQKWTHPEDLHITLKFLGDTPVTISEQLPNILQNVASSQQFFTLKLSGLGTFGKSSAPSILWAGIEGEMNPLRMLQKNVESALESLGFVPEQRAYNPHITLARRYQGKPGFSPDFLTPHNIVDPANASWTVNQFVLYRTHLGRKPMYEAAAAFPFS
jgi:2'-5' RNA ligase